MSTKAYTQSITENNVLRRNGQSRKNYPYEFQNPPYTVVPQIMFTFEICFPSLSKFEV